MSVVADTKTALEEHLNPTLEKMEENARQARKAILRARYAAEDLASGAGLQVRRHPLSAVALGAVAGAIGGCLFGFTLGRCTRDSM